MKILRACGHFQIHALALYIKIGHTDKKEASCLHNDLSHLVNHTHIYSLRKDITMEAKELQTTHKSAVVPECSTPITQTCANSL